MLRASTLFSALALTLLAAFAAPLATEDPVRPVTVVCVRHAEAEGATGEAPDPGLTEAGRARAEALARLLSHAGCTHVFTSELRRTRDTAAPLADAAGLEPAIHPVRDTPGLAERLAALEPGSVVLVAGHSNTVPALCARLGAPLGGLVEDARYGSMLPHEAYDRAFVVTLATAPGQAASVVELRYGEPSEH